MIMIHIHYNFFTWWSINLTITIQWLLWRSVRPEHHHTASIQKAKNLTDSSRIFLICDQRGDNDTTTNTEAKNQTEYNQRS